MIDEEYDIILPPDVKLHRVYDYLPYTPWRLKQILKDYYGAYLVCIRGYKEGRYPGYKQRYNIYDISTNKLLRKDVRLDDLRRLFAKEDIPLHDTIKRNPNAEYFLAIVNAIAKEQTNDKS